MSAVTTLSAEERYTKMWIPIENAAKPRIGKKVVVIHSEKGTLKPKNIFYGIFLGQTVCLSDDGKRVVRKQMWKVPHNSPNLTHWLKCDK